MNSKSGHVIFYLKNGYGRRKRDGRRKTRAWKFQPGSGALDRGTFHAVFRAVQSAIRVNKAGDEYAQRSSIIAALAKIGTAMGCTAEHNSAQVLWRIDGHKLLRFEVFSPDKQADAFRRLKRSGCLFRFFVNGQTGFITSFFSEAGQEFEKAGKAA